MNVTYHYVLEARVSQAEQRHASTKSKTPLDVAKVIRSLDAELAASPRAAQALDVRSFKSIPGFTFGGEPSLT